MRILPLGGSANDDPCGHMRVTIAPEKPYSKIYPVINAVIREGSVLWLTLVVNEKNAIFLKSMCS